MPASDQDNTALCTRSVAEKEPRERLYGLAMATDGPSYPLVSCNRRDEPLQRTCSCETSSARGDTSTPSVGPTCMDPALLAAIVAQATATVMASMRSLSVEREPPDVSNAECLLAEQLSGVSKLTGPSSYRTWLEDIKAAFESAGLWKEADPFIKLTTEEENPTPLQRRLFGQLKLQLDYNVRGNVATCKSVRGAMYKLHKVFAGT